MREYRYTVAEHEPGRPWIVIGDIRHLIVQLEDSENFYEWAAQTWPRTRYEVQLDPWQLTRRGR